MTRDDLLSLCECFADQRRGLVVGRLTTSGTRPANPVLEILRSFRSAEISESEKNALLSLVCDDEDRDFPAETTCFVDAVADERAGAFDDDDVG
jgi:hypothetical protein